MITLPILHMVAAVLIAILIGIMIGGFAPKFVRGFFE